MALLRQSIICFNRCLVQNVCLQTSRSIKRWVAPTLRDLKRRQKYAGPRPIDPRNTYLEWNYDAEIYAFAKRLGEEFDEQLLRRAFTDRSYVIKQEMKEEESLVILDNREMSKEGGHYISDCIKERFKNIYTEDVVDAIHSHLMSQSMLAHVAFHMGVKDLILNADYPPNEQTLANTFKALISALKQSTSDERAATFINDFLVCQLNGKDIYDIWDLKNPYEYLLRLLKLKGVAELEPRLCNQSAVNTILANYQVGLYSDKKLLGIGWGESIEVAKDTAAMDAIQRLQKESADC